MDLFTVLTPIQCEQVSNENYVKEGEEVRYWYRLDYIEREIKRVEANGTLMFVPSQDVGRMNCVDKVEWEPGQDVFVKIRPTSWLPDGSRRAELSLKIVESRPATKEESKQYNASLTDLIKECERLTAEAPALV